jgi:hypothetical protein
VLLAFAASVHAFRRDREDGIPALLRARGAAFGAYAWSRAYGLTLLLLIVVAGGTLASGLCATLVASRAGAAMRVAQGALAAFVYATAFAFTLGPLAVATLGNRSRAGGYFWLLMVLALPELLAPVTEGLVPPGFSELVSIPGALDALRAALMPPRLEPWRAVKALFVLTLVAFACAAVILRAARESQREEAAR